MKSINLSIVLNSLLLGFGVFIISLGLTYFSGAKVYVRLVIAILMFICASGLYFFKGIEKNAEKICIKTNAKLLDNAVNYLNFADQTQAAAEVVKLLNYSNIPCRADGRFVFCKNAVIAAMFFTQELTVDKLKKLLDKIDIRDRKVIIISDSFCPGCEKFCNDEIILIKTKIFAALLVKYNLINIPTACKPKRNIFKALFKKTNGLKFIGYGGMLLGMSFIVFYPVYYIISGTIFVIFGLIARFFGNSETKCSDENKLFEALGYNANET